MMSSKEVMTDNFSKNVKQDLQYASSSKVRVSPLRRTAAGSVDPGVNSKAVTIGPLQLLNKCLLILTIPAALSEMLEESN